MQSGGFDLAGLALESVALDTNVRRCAGELMVSIRAIELVRVSKIWPWEEWPTTQPEPSAKVADSPISSRTSCYLGSWSRTKFE
jgi:hypothetical protein